MKAMKYYFILLFLPLFSQSGSHIKTDSVHIRIESKPVQIDSTQILRGQFDKENDALKKRIKGIKNQQK
jgi:hypothetical protein